MKSGYWRGTPVVEDWGNGFEVLVTPVYAWIEVKFDLANIVCGKCGHDGKGCAEGKCYMPRCRCRG